jgi:hypothetical protein
MIVQFLNELDLTPEHCFESMGQVIDSMVQVLEEVEKQITKQPAVSRSLGELEAFLRKENLNELAGHLSEIRGFRKTINVRQPGPDKVEELKEMVIALIRESGHSELPHKYRIRYVPVMENSTGIESPIGFSRFNLYHGSILHVKCKTLVVSACSNGKNMDLDGQVINALKWRFVLPEEANLTVTDIQCCCISWYEVKHLDSFFDHLIVVSIDKKFGTLKNERQQELHRQLFAGLNQLDYMGVDLSEIGLSFLFGNRTVDKERSVQSLVLESLMWLKQAKSTKSIHCSLLHKDELCIWNDSMNRALSRSSVDPSADPMLEALKLELLSVLDGHKEGVLKDGVNPLLSALSTKDGLNIELVCTFSRTLCELIVRDTCRRHSVKSSGDLLSSIERLRTEGIASPWVCSYMHGIRVLGNKSVHPPKSLPKFKPSKLEIRDLSAALIGIRSLLEFWQINAD